MRVDSIFWYSLEVLFGNDGLGKKAVRRKHYRARQHEVIGTEMRRLGNILYIGCISCKQSLGGRQKGILENSGVRKNVNGIACIS